MQGGVAVAEEGVLEQRLLLLAVGAAEVVVQPPTNSGLTKLILYQYVVRTDRDLTNYVKWWNSII